MKYVFPNHSTPPKGNPTDPLEKTYHGHYGDDIANALRDLTHARKLNRYLTILCGICVVATVLVTTTYNYKTYVVRVDNATGQVETGGQLKATNYSPREAEITHFLGQFVMDTRGVPMDPVQYKNNWDKAQHFLTQEGGAKLAALYKQDNPTAKLGKMTVQPVITSIQLQPGTKNVYQVRWTERDFSINGGSEVTPDKQKHYVALFTVIVDPPTKEQELLINPLGLKIKDMTFALEATTDAKEAAK